MNAPRPSKTITLSELADSRVDGQNLPPRAIVQRRIFLALTSGAIAPGDAIRLLGDLGMQPSDAVTLLRSLAVAGRQKIAEFDVVAFKARLRAMPVNGKLHVTGQVAFESARQVASWFGRTHAGFCFATRLNPDARGGTVIRIDADLPRSDALQDAAATPSRRGRKRTAAGADRRDDAGSSVARARGLCRP